MKYRMSALILVILLLMTLFSGCSAAQTMDTAEVHIEQSVSQAVTPAPLTTAYVSPTPDQITQAEAMDIALAHAGVTADQAQYLYTEYEIDDRIPQYDVQFYVGNMEYEYEIHAETGDILSFDRNN